MPRRSLPGRIAWTLRDYAKRVWDNAGEDNNLLITKAPPEKKPATSGTGRSKEKAAAAD